MAIVQISKIIHRTGANIDLPQLDVGEIGFATDEQRVYIGNDPNIVPPVSVDATTQTEILTTASPLDFSRLNGSSNATLEMTTPTNGELLGINVANAITTVVNVGGNAGGLINLGNVGNVKLNGGINGYVLQTDGQGNLTWTTNGSLYYDIANVSQTNPAVVTTKTTHMFGTGAQITIANVAGMTQLSTGGVSATNQYYIYRLSNTTFSLFKGPNVADPLMQVNATLFFPATANTGFCIGQITPTGNATVDGANTQIQFNDGGSFGASGNLTFNKANNTLTITGNTISTNITSSNITGVFNGTIGCTTPNLASFTSITVNNNANVVGNIDVGNVIIVDDVSANNASITEEITGNIVSVNTANLLYDAGANSWSMFANADGIFLTDSGTGNTFQVNLTQI
jgi:hypothetical protein